MDLGGGVVWCGVPCMFAFVSFEQRGKQAFSWKTMGGESKTDDVSEQEEESTRRSWNNRPRAVAGIDAGSTDLEGDGGERRGHAAVERGGALGAEDAAEEARGGGRAAAGRVDDPGADGRRRRLLQPDAERV